MKWIDRFWSVGADTLNFGIFIIADTLNAFGAVFNIVGGGTLALYQAMNSTLSVSYYGSGNATGEVLVGLEFPAFNYSLFKTIPFERYLQKDDELRYHFEDYVSPASVLEAGTIATALGATLSLVGTNLKHWQQDRQRRHYFATKHHVIIPPAQTMEWVYLSSESIAASFTVVLLSCSVVGAVLEFSGFIGQKHRITYPSNGLEYVNSLHYKGPVKSLLIPFQFLLHDNETLKLPIIDLDAAAELQVKAKAIVNATYGGDLVVKSNETTMAPLIASTSTLAMTSYLASTFFGRKAKIDNEERYFQENTSGYEMAPGVI